MITLFYTPSTHSHEYVSTEMMMVETENKTRVALKSDSGVSGVLAIIQFSMKCLRWNRKITISLLFIDKSFVEFIMAIS